MIGNTNDRNVVSGQNEVSSAMADDIPPEIAEHMFALISDMKLRGQIPDSTNDMELMKSLHADMLKERQQYLMSQQLLLPSHSQPLSRPSFSDTPKTTVAGGGDEEQFVNPESLITMIMDYITLCSDNHNGHNCSSSVSHESNPFFRDFLKSAMESIQKNPSLVNETDPETADSVLHLAVSQGLNLLVRILLANGANVNKQNKCRQSAVHVAARAGHIMLIEMLLKAGADLTLRDSKGWTALHHAAAGTSLFCPHTVHYLTSCHDMSYTDLTDDGWTILHVITSVAKENNMDLLGIVLSQPQVDVLSTDEDGNTALHLATETAQPFICYQIVNSTGAKSLLLTNKAGKSALDLSRSTHSMQGYLLGKEMEKWLEKGPNYRPRMTYPYEYNKQMYGPTAVFLLFVLLSKLSMPENQGWLCTAGILLLQALVFLPSHRINHPSRLPNPCRFAGVAGALIFTTCISVFILIPYTYATRPATCLLMSVSLAAMAYLYFKLLVSDPGFTKESKRKESGEFYTMRDLVNTFQKPGIWCSACQLIPTKPSKHCKLCNRCVYWMDHHCIYTMRCVGYNTYHIFMWYTISLVSTQLCYISLLDTYLQLYHTRSSWFDMLASMFCHEGFVFVISAGVVCFCAFTIPLLFRSLYNVSYGYTTFFKPRDSNPDTVDSDKKLSLVDKLLNVFTFLAAGRIRTRDPAFKL